MKQLAMLAFFAKYHNSCHSVANHEVKRAKRLVELGFLKDLGNQQFQFTGKTFLN